MLASEGGGQWLSRRESPKAGAGPRPTKTGRINVGQLVGNVAAATITAPLRSSCEQRANIDSGVAPKVPPRAMFQPSLTARSCS